MTAKPPRRPELSLPAGRVLRPGAGWPHAPAHGAPLAFGLALLVAVSLFGARSPGAWADPGPGRVTPCEIIAFEMGTGGVAKPGAWAPVTLRAAGGDDLRAEVIAPDADGVPVSYPLGEWTRDAGAGTPREATARGIVKFGRREARVEARVSAGGATVARRVLRISACGDGNSAGGAAPLSLASTDRLIVALLPDPDLMPRIARDDRPTRVARLERFSELPWSAGGYDAVDVLLLGLSDAAVYSGATADAPQAEALLAWVRGGGKTVLIGASAAQQLLGSGGPLAGLAPGPPVGVATVTDAAPLEVFARARQPVAGGARVRLPVARFEAYRGSVLAAAGGRAATLPLVLRWRVGFGEVTLVAVDLTLAPLADWPGAGALLTRAAGLESTAAAARRDDEKLINRGATDLSGALMQRLGSRFAGVRTIPVAAFVVAAVTYLLLLGPGDFFLVRKLLRRPGAAWITFPLLAGLATAAAAYASWRLGGEGDRVNQITLLDFDLPSGEVRGRLWASAYSPSAARRDLSLAFRWPSGALMKPRGVRLSWLSVPGAGQGGLDRSFGVGPASSAGYATTAGRDRLLGFAIEPRSARSVAATWRDAVPAGAKQPIAAGLTSSGPGVMKGPLTNQLGVGLLGCWLAYGEWAWRLGDLPQGATVWLQSAPQPIKLTTLFRRDYLGRVTREGPRRRAEPPSRQIDTRGPGGGPSADALLQLVLLARSLDRANPTGLRNRVHHRLDLSGALRLGAAVLVTSPAREGAGERAPVASLLSDGRPWGRGSGPHGGVCCRFVVPVQKSR